MKILLIGYGNIARRHLEVFRALGCEVVASCNRNEENCLKARNEGLIPRTYKDYLEMVRVEKADAIINCASFENIYQSTRDLLPLGIPMLIEKPAGTNIRELNDLIELQAKYKTKVQVALNRRHYSVVHKAIADAGGIANINMFAVEWSENPLKVKRSKNYKDEQLVKLLVGNSIHGLDTLSWYTGGLKDFSVHAKTDSSFFGWNMMLAGRSHKDVLVNFTSSWNSPVPWRIVLYAPGKRYEFAPLETCRVWEEGSDKVREIQPDAFDISYKAGFYRQAQHFIDVVKGAGLKHAHDLSSCVDAMRIIEEIYKKLGVETS